MGTISNGESGLSVRNKLNEIIDKVEGNATITNDVLFGDNDKAIFGAGSDLQIYANGGFSYIDEVGASNLNIRTNGANIGIYDTANGQYMAKFTTGGDAELYHNGSEKLATTSTGIDVTGTVTSDGLTVDGLAKIQGPATGLVINETDTTDLNTYFNTNSGDFNLMTTNDAFTSFTTRLNIDHSTGDISFYEDTGTTPKLTWDASAEMLTTSGLTVESTATTRPTIGNSDVNTSGLTTGLNFKPISNLSDGAKLNIISGFQPTVTSAYTAGFEFVTQDHAGGGSFAQTKALSIGASGDISFYEDTGTTAKFFWDASAERLSLGTTSASTELHVKGSGDYAALTLEATTSGGASYVNLGDSADIDVGQLAYFNSDNSMRFTTNASEAMRIDSSGSVGVGTSSPATKLDVQGTTTTNGLNLDAISDTISDTAVDIFVYDTRKDSDGGAWRKRTQHTSWYNETLNTATRGSRKEFPAVAVIVAESTQVTIYDGDDPDLPMWMVFNAPSTTPYNIIANISANLTSITALNGVICFGNGANYGLGYINFISEVSFPNWRENAHSIYLGSIAERNDQKGVAAYDTNYIVDEKANDVAMTVLPNAPIDAATGLPVPTIAVATDGGVSVIKDDGTVVDATQSVYGGPISIRDDGIFYVGRSTASTNVIYGFDLPSSDVSAQDYYYATNSAPYLGTATSGSLVQDIVRTSADSFSYGYNTHLGNIAEQRQAITTGMANYITSDYNTGWMNGDIKLATLSDTDDTDVTGSELVTNGTFDSDVSSWSHTNVNSGSTLAWDSNGALLTIGANGAYSLLYQNITTVVGKVYTASVDYTVTSGSTNVRLGIYNSGGTVAVEQVNTGYPTTGSGSLTVTFTATETTHHLRGQVIVNNTAVRFDNFSVRLAEEDRSVNGNGLQVFGTVTKNPVATGADLVAYSGWDASNYLVQPYNSDLDFGTGDFCVMGWYNTSNSTTTETLLSRVDSGNVAAINLLITSSETLILQTRQSSTSSTTTTTETVPTGVWNCFAFVRRNSGTVQEVYINGKLSISGTVTARNVSSSTGKVYLGYTPELAANAKGSMALWRISATAPSPEQIKKIYEDEKFLFQDGAQATLYGSSDAVTALAYDDSTELLHVGTSAGRSVFQGLRRVDNTTTAVGAAISASNGLVADE